MQIERNIPRSNGQRAYTQLEKRPRRPITKGDRLITASREGNCELILSLLESGAKINYRDGSAITPLFGALQRGNVNVVEFFIEKGADVNSSNNLGHTPLMAASAGHSDVRMQEKFIQIVKLLLQAGADISKKNYRSETALDIANRWNGGEIVSLLKKYALLLEEQLIDAILQNDLPQVQKLLNAGANPDSKLRGETCLILAARVGNVHISNALVDRGANVNAQCDFAGKTPIMSAIEWNHLHIVIDLAEIPEIDLSIVDHEGNNAFNHANHLGYPELVQLLQHSQRGK